VIQREIFRPGPGKGRFLVHSSGVERHGPQPDEQRDADATSHLTTPSLLSMTTGNLPQ